jgi:hypothetical protein
MNATDRAGCPGECRLVSGFWQLNQYFAAFLCRMPPAIFRHLCQSLDDGNFDVML